MISCIFSTVHKKVITKGMTGTVLLNKWFTLKLQVEVSG